MTIQRIFLTIALLLCGAASLFAQTVVTPTAEPKFDAALAKKTGAEKNGMRSYVLAILKTGPKDADYKGAERDEIFKGHMANLGKLAADGKLAVAGPFGKNDKAFRGLIIFAVTTVEEAEKLAATDPVIKSGMMVVEFVSWYGSAALMETNSIHKTIAEKKL